MGGSGGGSGAQGAGGGGAADRTDSTQTQISDPFLLNAINDMLRRCLTPEALF